jgi:hypothetical protein
MTNEEKHEADRNAWSTWLKKYIVRVKQDCGEKDKNEYKTKRIERLNTNNPR